MAAPTRSADHPKADRAVGTNEPGDAIGRICDQARALSDAGPDVIDLTANEVIEPPTDGVLVRLRLAPGGADASVSAGGGAAFSEAAARFLKRRYGVTVDPQREIRPIARDSNLYANVAAALIQRGDPVLVPDPCHPAIRAATQQAGGRIVDVPLRAELGWLPDLGEIRVATARAARLMWINYPNSPTGAHAPHSFYNDVAAFAEKYDLLLVADAGFNELYFRVPPPSLIEYAIARARVIEIHACWSAFAVSGGPAMGFAVGAPDRIARLGLSPYPQALCAAGAVALDDYMDREVIGLRDALGRRAHRLAVGLRELGWSVREPEATPYVWASVPGSDGPSAASAARLLSDARVAVLPGSAFGPASEGYLRFTVGGSDDPIDAALARIRQVAW